MDSSRCRLWSTSTRTRPPAKPSQSCVNTAFPRCRSSRRSRHWLWRRSWAPSPNATSWPASSTLPNPWTPGRGGDDAAAADGGDRRGGRGRGRRAWPIAAPFWSSMAATHRDRDSQRSARISLRVDEMSDDRSCRPERPGFETRAIHAGQPPDPTTGAVVTPVSFSTTFVQDSVGEHRGYEYARSANPTARCSRAVPGLLGAGGPRTGVRQRTGRRRCAAATPSTR